MRSVSEPLRSCLAAFALSALAVPASAHVQIDGSAALVSDYRYRGISLSDGRPAVQAGLEMTTDGWFAGAWASTTRNYGEPGTEVDLYAGWRGAVGTSRYTLTGYYYVDPRRSVMNYAELQALLSQPVGGVELELEASVAPEQTHIDEPNIYLAAGLSVPLKSRVSLSAHAGYENGSWHRKTDWDVGADYHHAAFRIGAHLIGVTGPACHGALRRGERTGLVGSVRVDL